MFKRWGRRWLMVLSVGLMAGCGDGGGDAAVVPPPAAAPTITSQPSDAQVVAGGEARFQASAQGTALTWTWQRSNDNGTTWFSLANAGTTRPDNSTSFLVLGAVTLADHNARLRAVATSAGLQTPSSAATLTVSAQVSAPIISVQLVPQLAVAGGTASFAVTAVGTDLQYQWQSSRDGSTWADVAAATAPTLSLPALSTDADGTQYRVVVRNSAGSVTSNPVTLSVTAPAAAPAFTLQPLAAAVTVPNTASFTVAVTGQPAPTLQWQRSSNGGANYVDIPGATGASHTPPATTLADNGTLFRVVASSSAGSATSQAATLTVGAALASPVITTQPLDATVAVAQTATWTAVASGVPTPAYQWQISTDAGVSFANINGATGSSYSLVVSAADDGKRYRVVVSNSQGSSNSRAAVLTVPAPVSVLEGRGWVAGGRINNTSDFLVTQRGAEPQVAIDRAGRVHVLYLSLSAQGSWDVMVSTSLPGQAGAAPDYGTPVVLRGSTAGPMLPDGLWLAPDGNASALWTEPFPCPNDPQESCLRSWQSSFDTALGTWGVAALATAQEVALLKGKVNDAGDRIAVVPRAGGSSGLPLWDLGWRQSGRSDIETLPLGTGNPMQDLLVPLTNLALDNSGAVVLVAVQVGADGAANLVARRGSIRTGLLGADELLETRSAPATLNGFWSNTAGQVVVLWYQDNGTRVTQYASTLNSSTGNWVTTDLGARSTTDVFALGALTASGDFYAYSRGNCRTLRRVDGTWIAAAALPADLCASNAQWAMDGNGNLLVVTAQDGRWASFDASRQALVQSFVGTAPTTGPGYVLGTRWNALPGTLLLADNGIGAFVSVNSFDALPTASSPNGDSRGPSFTNLWGIYFK